MKKCKDCKIEKPLSEFYCRSNGRPVARCKLCSNIYRKKLYDPQKNNATRRRWRKNHPEQSKLHNKTGWLKREYNLTLEEYNKLLIESDYKCKICGSKWNLSIDHDHVTGKVRDIVCGKCNTAMGMSGDNPILLRKMADYLERHHAQRQTTKTT